MKLPLLSCLWIGALLVSCDKQRGAADNSANDGSSPGTTRASRSGRQDIPGRQKDLRASLAAAKKITAPEERDKALIEVAHAALELNPNVVAEVIRLLSPDHPERLVLLKTMVARLMQDDPNSATAWVATLEMEQERALGNGEIALYVANSDPAKAAKLLAESGMTGREFDDVAVQVLDHWAVATPDEAAAWVLRFPPGASRETAVKTVVTRWVQGDAHAAFSWVATLNNPAVRKETSRAVAHVLVNNPDPIRDSMLEEADPAMRSDLEQQIVQIVEESRDKSEPEPEPEPEVVATPEPQPAPEVAPEPALEPAPEVAPEPAPEPEPEMEPEEGSDEDAEPAE